MSERTFKKREPTPRSDDTVVAEEGVGEPLVDAETQAKNDALKAVLDDLLDDIDLVLEPNAHDFVKNYVQKGGE
jgi:ubiquitin-like protein Pup